MADPLDDAVHTTSLALLLLLSGSPPASRPPAAELLTAAVTRLLAIPEQPSAGSGGAPVSAVRLWVAVLVVLRDFQALGDYLRASLEVRDRLAPPKVLPTFCQSSASQKHIGHRGISASFIHIRGDGLLNGRSEHWDPMSVPLLSQFR